ncbi:MAG: efflux RND transporter permease subunit [Patescibacteria group bacterium]
MRIPSWRENRKEWLILALTALISLVMAYGFWVCPKGGLLSNGLLNKKDYYFQSEHKVQNLRPKGFEGGDQFSFVLPFGENFTKKDLKELLKFHEKTRESFPEYGLLSLAKAVHYPETGDLGDPYIYEELLGSQDFNLEDWKKRVKEDPGVYDVLVGKDFDYAQVIVFLPSDYNEIELRNRVASFLEKRKISKWEWFIKSDIHPVEEYEDVLVAGWPVGRGLMDAALISDILKYSTIGLILVVLILYPLLGSWRQAFYCWLMIILGLFWTRGTVGWLEMAGFELYGEAVKERVYILLTFTAVIIQGISFGSRKFDAFNYFKSDSARNRWKKTSWFDGKIYIVAIIAILNFAGLYQIQIRGILEMGFLASVGIVYLVFMTKWMLPALQTLFGGEVKERKSNAALRAGELFLQKITRGCFIILTRFSPGKTFAGFSVFALVTVGGVLGIVWHDYQAHKSGETPIIKIGTNPIDYLPGTIVDRARQFLNQEDRAGFGVLKFLVQPKDDVHDPEFVKKVHSLQEEALAIEGVRTSQSIIDTVGVISGRQYNLDFPENSRQTMDIFTTIDWDLGEKISSQLWYENGVTLALSVPANDSNQLAGQSEELFSLARNNYPNLEVIPFGRLHTYHRTDKYIREKSPANVVTSFWIVAVCAAIWISIRTHGMSFRKRRSVMSNWKTGIAMAVPFAFACSCMVYLMAIFKIPLDQATACIMALAVNAAIDFNLHFVDDFNEALSDGHDYSDALEHALCVKGGINIIDIVVNALCFSMLMFSSFTPISRLGMLLAIMMFACGFGALVIMPSILYYCIKPFNSTAKSFVWADRFYYLVKSFSADIKAISRFGLDLVRFAIQISWKRLHFWFLSLGKNF